MEVQKEKEGELILKSLQPGDVIVLLDEHGKEMRSLRICRLYETKMNTVNKRLVSLSVVEGNLWIFRKGISSSKRKISMSK